MIIRGLRRLGLVWNVKLPSPELIARRRRKTAPLPEAIGD
jgi:hypothetical protein